MRGRSLEEGRSEPGLEAGFGEAGLKPLRSEKQFCEQSSVSSGKEEVHPPCSYALSRRLINVNGPLMVQGLWMQAQEF